MLCYSSDISQISAQNLSFLCLTSREISTCRAIFGTLWRSVGVLPAPIPPSSPRHCHSEPNGQPQDFKIPPLDSCYRNDESTTIIGTAGTALDSSPPPQGTLFGVGSVVFDHWRFSIPPPFPDLPPSSHSRAPAGNGSRRSPICSR
ncbi:hypothetical protein CLAIMM_06272 [Cladophialophora immunda]|nr:hypothetical protein CLAIMM_06272 [Cladophialophora immunda]